MIAMTNAEDCMNTVLECTLWLSLGFPRRGARLSVPLHLVYQLCACTNSRSRTMLNQGLITVLASQLCACTDSRSVCTSVAPAAIAATSMKLTVEFCEQQASVSPAGEKATSCVEGRVLYTRLGDVLCREGTIRSFQTGEILDWYQD